MKRTPGRRILRGVAVAAVLGFTLFPAFLMFSMSVDTHASAGKRSLLPTDLTLDHFAFVLDEGGFTTYLRNSFVVAIGTVLISLCSPCSSPSLGSGSGSGRACW